MKRIWWPQLVAAGMLLWALNPDNPYAYYVLLRWVCCAVFAYVAIHAFRLQREGWVWLLGFMAAIYNPIIPVHLTREIWSIINLISVGVAVGSIVSLLPKEPDIG